MPSTDLNIFLKMRDTITKPLKGVMGRIESFGSSLKRNWLGISAAIVATFVIVKKAWDQLKLGAKIEQQETAFKSLAQSYGVNTERMISDLKRASAQTISTMDLMTQASRAMALGIDPSRFGELMEISRAAARAMGQDVNKMFKDIVVGIGRQSRLILDNLGIIVQSEKAYKDYAATLGITVEALSDTQKRQAFMNATIKAGEEIIKRVNTEQRSQAEALQSVEASLENVYNALIKVGNESEVINQLADFLDKASTIAENFTLLNLLDEMDDLISKMNGLDKGINGFVFGMEKALDITTTSSKFLGKYREELVEVTRALMEMGEFTSFAEDRIFPLLTVQQVAGLRAYRSELNSISLGLINAGRNANGFGVSLNALDQDIKVVDQAMRESANVFVMSREVMLRVSESSNKIMLDGWLSVVQGLEHMWANVFYGIFTGTIDSLSDAFEAFGKNILRILAQVIAKMLVVWALGKLFGMFSGGIKSISGGAGVGFATGTPYVPATGMAVVHRGEKIIPAHQNDQGGGGIIQNFFISAWDVGDMAAKKNLIMGWMREGVRQNSSMRYDFRRYT